MTSIHFEQFAQKVRITETCWLWEASCFSEGYGYFKNRKAHRVSYELFKGSVPDGLQLDHLCRVRHCVNPAHLEAVTNQVNVIRAKRGEPCPHGNVVKRRCKPCLATKMRELRANRRLKTA